MVYEVFNNFFPKFGVGDALNFDNGPKSYSETHQTGVKIFAKQACSLPLTCVLIKKLQIQLKIIPWTVTL